MKPNIVSTVAKVLLIVILLPFILQVSVFIASIPGSEDTFIIKFIYNIIDSIPLFDTWVSILNEIIVASERTRRLSLEDAGLLVGMSSVFFAFLEAVVLALCIKFFEKLESVTKTGSFLPTVLGVVIATVICFTVKIVFVDSDSLGALITYGGTIVVMLIGITIALKCIFKKRKKSFNSMMFYIDVFVCGISAVITSGYLTVTILAINGYVGTIFDTIKYCFIFTVIEIINVILLRVVTVFMENLKDA